MARIRTIKPEYWTSEQVIECSLSARLLFIGLWNFCDDRGRMAFSAKRIKACIFPSDDLTSENVLGMIAELERQGLIRLYVVDGKEYLLVTGWKHQRIDKPQKPQTPEPPDDTPPTTPRTFGDGEDRKGEDRKGRESLAGAAAVSDPARRVLNEAGPGEVATGEAAAAAAPDWRTRANFDRVEARCRTTLGAQAPNDPQVGPIAKLEADGFDLEAEILPALLDAAAGRKRPIATWRLFADIVRERVEVQRTVRVAEGKPATPLPARPTVDLGHYGCWPEHILVEQIAKHRANPHVWPHFLGPKPGEPGCKIPARLLVGEVAA